MAIRQPLTIFSFNDAGEVGAGSAAGAVYHSFILPQDTDNVVVKFRASTVGGAVSAVFQTSDDGGTTYYDSARTSIVSNANNNTAQWLSIPVIGMGIRTTVGNGVIGSVGGGTSASALSATGGASSLTLGHSQVSGLPILGQAARVGLIITGDLTASAVLTTEVKVQSQSATA